MKVILKGIRSEMAELKRNLIFFAVGFVVVMAMVLWFSLKNGDQVKDTAAKKSTKAVTEPNLSDNQNIEQKTDNPANPSSSDTPTKIDNPPVGIAPDVVSTKSADNYYTEGLRYANEKNYAEAINNFSQAISLDPSVPNYYVEKSKAEYSSGNKSVAIDTVNQGLAKIPGNSLLQDQLDILNSL